MRILYLDSFNYCPIIIYSLRNQHKMRTVIYCAGNDIMKIQFSFSEWCSVQNVPQRLRQGISIYLFISVALQLRLGFDCRCPHLARSWASSLYSRWSTTCLARSLLILSLQLSLSLPSGTFSCGAFFHTRFISRPSWLLCKCPAHLNKLLLIL